MSESNPDDVWTEEKVRKAAQELINHWPVDEDTDEESFRDCLIEFARRLNVLPEEPG